LIYAADFLEVAADVKANKQKLGFSFEARELMTLDPHADAIPIVECAFTEPPSCSGTRLLTKPRH
jgi:hypothetical protein